MQALPLLLQNFRNDEPTESEDEPSFSSQELVEESKQENLLPDIEEQVVVQLSPVQIQEPPAKQPKLARDRSPQRKRKHSASPALRENIDFRNGKFVIVTCTTSGLTRSRRAIIRDNSFILISLDAPVGQTKVTLDKIVSLSNGWKAGSRVVLDDNRNCVLPTPPQIFVSWLKSDSSAPLCQSRWTLVKVEDIQQNCSVGGCYNIVQTATKKIFRVINIIPELCAWLNSDHWMLNLSATNYSNRRVPLQLNDAQQVQFFDLTRMLITQTHDLLVYISSTIPLFYSVQKSAWCKAGIPLAKKVNLFTPVAPLFPPAVDIKPRLKLSDLILIPSPKGWRVLPSQVKKILGLPKDTFSLKQDFAKACPSFAKLTYEEYARLLRVGIVRRGNNTFPKSVLLGELLRFLDSKKLRVPDAFRNLAPQSFNNSTVVVLD